MIEKIKSEISKNQLEKNTKKILNFKSEIENFIKNCENLIFLTSGGTKVPLEQNCVRFIDNFSTGTRGSLLCQ
jgi:phosphopantothenoylcysteine synthetase/decarboxylase